MNSSELAQVIQDNSSNNSRGKILDRNGVLLAANIQTYSLYANPKQIKVRNIHKKIANILKLPEQVIWQKLNSNKQFVWIKRHISPLEKRTIESLGITGLYSVSDEKRVYPTENLLSHLVGTVDVDGDGTSGIESYFNDSLKKQDIEISIDVRIQHAVREVLASHIELHQAAGGIGIVMDVNNGEIIAMSSLPDFNPHHVREDKKLDYFNQATLSVQEMGSTFKVLTLAMALDAQKIKVNDAFNVSQKIEIDRFKIGDYRGGKGGYLSVPEILIYSSNIGAAHIAEKLGMVKQKEYWRKMGMFSHVDISLRERGRPIFPSDNRWNQIHLLTTSYGHGIAVTPIHSIRAFAAVVNGGILYNPQILKNENKKGERILQAKTSEIMKKILRLVVTKGVAKRAEVSGYFIGGKTGTAEKIKNGKYHKKLNFSSFIGAFPIHEPKYAIFVAIDEAKPNAINKGFTTGGMIAAPIAKEVIEKITAILGLLPYNQNQFEIDKKLQIEYIPRYRLASIR